MYVEPEGILLSQDSEAHLPQPIAGPRGSTQRNAVFRLIAYVASAIVFLAVLPYIIRHIGVEAYGIVGFSTNVLNYMAIATVAITSVIGRNLVFAIERRRYEEASKQLSTSLWGLGLVLIGSSAPALVLILLLDKVILIPPRLVTDAKVLIACTVISSALTTISLPFGASTFARNRLDIQSGLSLGKQVLTFGLIYLLFRTLGSSLTIYGVALIAASVVLAVANVGVCRRLLPGVHAGRKWVDLTILKQILSFGGWITVNHVGSLLYLQADLIVVNRVLGPTAAGQFAAISVVSTQLRAVGSMIAGLFDPNQTALVARGDIPGLVRYATRSMRITTMTSALLVGVFCGMAHNILAVWLGKDFASAAPVAMVLTAHLIVNLGVLPLFGLQLAMGGVRWPGIVTLVLGVMNVLLGITLAGPLGLGLMGVALSGCIVLTLKNVVFTPWYAARLCGLPPWPFLKELGLGLLMGGVIFLIARSTALLFHPESWGRLILCLLTAGLLSLLPLAPIALRVVRPGRTDDADRLEQTANA